MTGDEPVPVASGIRRGTRSQSAKVAKDEVSSELTEAEFEEIKKFGGEYPAA